MRQNSKVSDISLMALFSALTAIGAFITIPIPPVPFTLQIFFAILAGALLGSKRGFISVGVYVLLGLCGLPVFTKGAGLSYIFQPTFGYLAGFILGAWVCGTVIELRKDYSFKTMLLGCFAGAGTDFAIGVVYFYVIMNLYLGKGMSLWAVLYSTFLIFIPADAVLMVLAAYLGKRLTPILKREQLIS